MSAPAYTNGRLWAKIIIYIGYRLLQIVLLIESNIYSMLVGLFDKPPENAHVEVFNIIAKFRLDTNDICHDSDFAIFHERWTTMDEISQKGWFIYSINERFIYFIKLDTIEEELEELYETMLTIEKCSKMPRFLFNNCEKIARIDIETFELCAKNLPPFQSNVVILYSTPCGGGTVAAKLVQSCDSSKHSLLVLGEPPVLSSLAYLYNYLSIEKMRQVAKSTLRYSMLHQKPNQTIVLKARPCCTKIVPYIHSACPSIQHIFIANRNYSDVISRLVIYTSVDIPIFEMACHLMTISRNLCDFFTNWRQIEMEMVTKVGASTEVEFAVAQVYGALVNYQRNNQYFATDLIYVDDLINDTVKKIRPILQICNVSDLAIPECIEWKRATDEVLKTIWDRVDLSPSDMKRVHHLVELIQRDCYIS